MADKPTIKTQELALVAKITEGTAVIQGEMDHRTIHIASGVVTYSLGCGLTVSHASTAYDGPPVKVGFFDALASLRTAQALDLEVVAINAAETNEKPAVDEPTTVDLMKLSTNDLLSVLPFTAERDHRRVLMGIDVEIADEIRQATATSGKRLGRRAIRVVGDTARGFRCWVPRDLLLLLQRAGAVEGAEVSAIECRTNGDGTGVHGIGRGGWLCFDHHKVGARRRWPLSQL